MLPLLKHQLLHFVAQVYSLTLALAWHAAEALAVVTGWRCRLLAGLPIAAMETMMQDVLAGEANVVHFITGREQRGGGAHPGPPT